MPVEERENIMRWVRLVLLIVLMWVTVPGCGKTPPPAKPLTSDQEQKLQQQLEKARQAEGASQRKASK